MQTLVIPPTATGQPVLPDGAVLTVSIIASGEWLRPMPAPIKHAAVVPAAEPWTLNPFASQPTARAPRPASRCPSHADLPAQLQAAPAWPSPPAPATFTTPASRQRPPTLWQTEHSPIASAPSWREAGRPPSAQPQSPSTSSRTGCCRLASTTSWFALKVRAASRAPV